MLEKESEEDCRKGNEAWDCYVIVNVHLGNVPEGAVIAWVYKVLCKHNKTIVALYCLPFPPGIIRET